MKYSNIVPDQDAKTLKPSDRVKVLPSRYQCLRGTCFLTMARKLVCLASDAIRS